jgi:uncharacterized protein with HEPN domain
MYDRELAKEIIKQIASAIDTVRYRCVPITKVDDFLSSPEGLEKLDAICMQLIAIGESLKNFDKITGGKVLKAHPEIDWRGAMGMRDIICHHYFDLDADAIFMVCKEKIEPLGKSIEAIRNEIVN